MTRLIKPFGTGKSKFIPAAEAMKKLDEIVVPEEPPAESHEPLDRSNICARERDSCYQLLVSDENNLYQIDWGKEYFGRGAELDQRSWLNYKDGNGLILPSPEMYIVTFTLMYSARNSHDSDTRKTIMKMKEMFKEDFNNRCMMTSTSVQYEIALDDIVRKYGLDGKKTEYFDHVMGFTGWRPERPNFRDAVKTILGTPNMYGLEKTIAWMFAKTPTMLTLNSAPPSDKVCDVLLGSHSTETFEINILQTRPKARARGARYTLMDEEKR